MSTKLYHKKFSIDHYSELPSTNSLAFQLAKSYQIDHRHIILSDLQTAGRGRMDRNWISPTGNLYFSLVLKPQKSITTSSQISFVATTAMGLAIAEFGGRRKINYKWPNDILLGGEKVAGILLESDAPESPNGFIILGIGVNINSHPNSVIYPACNLVDQGFVIGNKTDLLKKFLDHFDILYQKWLDFGFAPIRNLWLDRAFNLDEQINVNLSGRSLKGVFKDLDQGGNLILGIDKENILISSGEVFTK